MKKENSAVRKTKNENSAINKTKDIKENFRYALAQGMYWMYYGAVYSFSSAYLLDRGYSNWYIGLILALGNILAIVLQPVVANFADRTARFNLTDIIKGMTVILAILTFGILLFDSKHPVLTFAFIAAIGLHTVMHPFINSLAFEIEKTGKTIYFSIDRAMGSVAYAALVAVLGVIVGVIGVAALPVSGLITLAGLMMILIVNGRSLKDSGAVTGRKKSEITFMQFVKRNRMFFVMSIGVVGLYFSNSVFNNFMLQIVHNVGGDSGDMGGILSLMAAMEIPTMLLFYRIKVRVSTEKLLRIAAAGFAIKCVAVLMAGTVPLLYASQLLQLVSFALFLPSMVHFINEKMSGEEAVRGQAIFTTMVTVGAVLASVTGGVILDAMGATALLWISTVITAAGAALVIIMVPRCGKRNT